MPIVADASATADALWMKVSAQLLAAVLLPTVFLGVVEQVGATLSGRRGARLLHPWRDLRRALRKGASGQLVSRGRHVVGLLAALGLAALAPLVGPRSPLAFAGDVAASIGLLAVWRLSRRGPESPRFGPLLTVVVALALFVGARASVAEIAAARQWEASLPAIVAVALALRVSASPGDDPGEGDAPLARGLSRTIDAVVDVALAGTLAALVHPLPTHGAWPAAGVQVALILAIAALVGVARARTVRPRRRAEGLYLGGAAICGGLAVLLHARGVE